ncbi:hypothetical protein MITS9508_00602 [Synechococcus sp. MIT S9508]|nr:hypothetical protein MITS9508_00602 [Synechococcus sp. MIT S9508]
MVNHGEILWKSPHPRLHPKEKAGGGLPVRTLYKFAYPMNQQVDQSVGAFFMSWISLDDECHVVSLFVL